MKKIIVLVLCSALALTMFATPALAFTKQEYSCPSGIRIWYFPDYGTFSGRFARLAIGAFLMSRCSPC